MASNKEIPIEITTTEILSRLPVKSLTRFKCVSKQWKNIVESKYFFKHHLQQSLTVNTYNCSLILNINRTLTVNGSPTIVNTLYRAYLDQNSLSLNINKLVLPPSFQPAALENISRLNNDYIVRGHGKVVFGRIEVAGSCNGLVLILGGLHHIAVCNPNIERQHASFKILPRINYEGYLSQYIDYQTNYRKFMSNFRVFGFGYDCYSLCYKVVYLTPTKAFLYSFAKVNRTWREIDLPYFDSTSMNNNVLSIQAYNHGVATNNHLHWNITEFDPVIDGIAKELIISFDLHKEEWGVVPVPDELDQGHIIELGELNGCLSYLIYQGPCDHELWIMKEYGAKDSWTKLCNVAKGSGIPLVYRIERDEFLLPGIQVGLGWYNPKVGIIRRVQFHGCEFTGEQYYSTRVKLCIESFVDPFTSMEREEAAEEIHPEVE